MQFLLLPIRDWNWSSLADTELSAKALQFLLLPIRDWNLLRAPVIPHDLNCNFYYSLLGIETTGNLALSICNSNCNFYYSLLGIETPVSQPNLIAYASKLQFLLLPIRDWNPACTPSRYTSTTYCNFYYSLLGIETDMGGNKHISGLIAISITPY